MPKAPPRKEQAGKEQAGKEQPEVPENLKPYKFHGLDFKIDGKQAIATCPFCDAPKFSVTTETGVGRCFKCQFGNEKGVFNHTLFLRKLWEDSFDKAQDYTELMEDRGYTDQSALVAWGICKSISNNYWIIPGYNFKGAITQLYSFKPLKGKDGTYKRRIMPTAGLRCTLFGLNLFDANKEVVYLCEGVWNAIALYELFVHHKDFMDASNIIATPGANIWDDGWGSIFGGKIVNIIFDNDHPSVNKKNGNVTPPAGFTGVKRVAKSLMANDHPPAEVHYLSWGQEGYTTDLPSGYDLRDHLVSSGE